MNDLGGRSADLDLATIEIQGRVKWFDTTKGYGFVTPVDGVDPHGPGDVLLHMSALRQAGIDHIDEGATVRCEAVRRAKGLQALKVLSCDASTAIASEMAPVPVRRPLPAVEDAGDFVSATIKWFNRARGYGFVSRGEGTPDVFVHMEVLRRGQVAEVKPGQPVEVRIAESDKGPLVADIRTV